MHTPNPQAKAGSEMGQAGPHPCAGPEAAQSEQEVLPVPVLPVMSRYPRDLQTQVLD